MLLIAGCGKQSGHDYETDLSAYTNGYKAAFVLYDFNNRYFIRYNKELCDEQLSPCSTFKVFNSLAALQSGALKDENEIIKWDSVDKGRPEWNKDHSMRSAIAVSCVWFYQEAARRTGAQKMQAYLDTVGYGNRDISGGIDKFWLMSSIKISANEQVDFLKRLYANELPFPQRNMDIVKDILVLEKANGEILSGKTGSGTGLGWFIGTVQFGNNLYIFALNIRGEDASGIKAKEITKQILKSMKILQ